MGIINKHNSDKMKCPTCGAMFDRKYLDQVVEHMHTDFKLDETIKGVKVKDGKKCPKCNINEAAEDHTCPYREDIEDDSESVCNCCVDCENQCYLDK